MHTLRRLPIKGKFLISSLPNCLLGSLIRSIGKRRQYNAFYSQLSSECQHQSISYCIFVVFWYNR